MRHAPVNTVTVSAENMQVVERQSDLNRVRTMSTMDAPAPAIDNAVREQIGRALCLQNLLQQITPENTHKDQFSDGPVGSEEW
jgi:hypothetical protein